MRVVHTVQDNTCILELLISDDSMKLFARVQPQREHILARVQDFIEKILTVTAQERIEVPVVQDIVKELKAGKGCEERRVAVGQGPVAGKDGKIVWLVRRFNPGKKEKVDGWKDKELVDFFTLGLFENVQAQREIARVYRPTLGTDGKNILGNHITATPGKPVDLRVEKSVTVKPGNEGDGYDILLAQIDGYVHDEGGLIAVKNVLTIPGDLDYGMGHIDFIGSVKILGDVNKGFHVKARGDIEIGGSLLGDNIIKSKGSVTVKGFHHGGQQSSVNANGDYSVSVAHEVNSEIHGTIRIGREARDSIFRSLSNVFADTASLVGGEVWCSKGAELGDVGSEAGAATVVQLRNELEVTEEYRVLNDKIKKHEIARSALTLHIGPYLKHRARIQLLKDPFKTKMLQLIGRYDEIHKALEQFQAKEKEMRTSKQVGDDARINIVKTAHAGVELCAGDGCRLRFADSVQGPTSWRFNREIDQWERIEYRALKKESKHGR
jgi:uncharacterized protein (DUF342 family)